MSCQRCYIIVLTNQFEKEICVINRDKTSEVFICSRYTICWKNTPHPFCLKQVIPIANTHDGALPVSLWPSWVTLLLKGEEVCVYGGHGAGFTGLWLVECNADEDFIQSAVLMMGEHRVTLILLRPPDPTAILRFFSLRSFSCCHSVQLVYLYAHLILSTSWMIRITV